MDESYYGRATSPMDAMTIKAPPRQRRSDNVREEVERLVARLSAVRVGVADLLERIGAPYPPEPDTATKEALSAMGFVPSFGVAVEKSHIEAGRIENLLGAIAEVI